MNLDTPIIIGSHDDYVSAIIIPEKIDPNIIISSGRDKLSDYLNNV